MTCFVSRPSGITLVNFHSLQVTIKTNLLAELRKNEKNTKASEVYDGQACAEVRHTAARSLDTEKVGHGFFFSFKCAKYRVASICGIAASETYIFIYTSICTLILRSTW